MPVAGQLLPRCEATHDTTYTTDIFALIDDFYNTYTCRGIGKALTLCWGMLNAYELGTIALLFHPRRGAFGDRSWSTVHGCCSREFVLVSAAGGQRTPAGGFDLDPGSFEHAAAADGDAGTDVNGNCNFYAVASW